MIKNIRQYDKKILE